LIAGKSNKGQGAGAKPKRQPAKQVPKGSKRKATEALAVQMRKKQKVEQMSKQLQRVPPVLLLSQKDLYPFPRTDPLVGDWTRLTTVKLPSWADLTKSKAALEVVEELAKKDGHQFIVDDELMEDEAEYEEMEEDDAEAIDPEALQMALKANFEKLGFDISSVDQESLLKLAHSMMAGEANADELLAEFADGLMDEGDDDEELEAAETALNDTSNAKPNDSGFGSWVSDQAKASAGRKGSLAVQASESNGADLDGSDVENEVPEEVQRGSKRKRGPVANSAPTRKRTRRGNPSVTT
jgi:hypothetical protein